MKVFFTVTSMTASAMVLELLAEDMGIAIPGGIQAE
jgi:hypothetical protein